MATSRPAKDGHTPLTSREQIMNHFLQNGYPALGPGMSGPSLQRLSDCRTDYTREVAALYEQQFDLNNVDGVDDYLNTIRLEPEQEVNFKQNKASIIEGSLWKCRGTVLFKAGRYKDARDAYTRAIQASLGHQGKRTFPPDTAFVDAMVGANHSQFADAFTSAGNIAQCYIKENNIIRALEVLEAFHCMYKTFEKILGPNRPAWLVAFLPFEDIILARIKGWIRQASLCMSIGNTSAGANFAFLALRNTSTHFPEDTKLKEESGIKATGCLRHPDPSFSMTATVTVPELQVRGVWKKIVLRDAKAQSPPAKHGYVSALYNGIYYVFHGTGHDGAARPQGWALSLRELSKWRKIQPIPGQAGSFFWNRLIVFKAKAYLFTGEQRLLVFDFETEKWTTAFSKLRDSTPWKEIFPKNFHMGYTSAIAGDKLYVFGGRKEVNDLGVDLLLSLDLSSLEWEVLSGSPDPVPSDRLPGLRGHSTSWIAENRLWIFSGAANRTGALRAKAEHGAGGDYTYNDLWSFDIQTKTWTQERIHGNAPSPRMQAGYTYNQKWDRVVVFGGCSSDIPFLEDGSGKMLTFSYLADTFVWAPQTKRWAHVITRGFPTWRVLGDLFTDPETGRTYLFGGWTNTDYTPSRKSSAAKHFNDMWELRIDVLGGDFEESDFEVDPRFTTLGAFVQCFNCGSIGRWMRCNGSCKRTDHGAFFCGNECRVEGWPEHKLNCKKV